MVFVSASMSKAELLSTLEKPTTIWIPQEFHQMETGLIIAQNLSPKIFCSFKNLAVNYFTFTALHSADESSNEEQIFWLNIQL